MHASRTGFPSVDSFVYEWFDISLAFRHLPFDGHCIAERIHADTQTESVRAHSPHPTRRNRAAFGCRSFGLPYVCDFFYQCVYESQSVRASSGWDDWLCASNILLLAKRSVFDNALVLMRVFVLLTISRYQCLNVRIVRYFAEFYVGGEAALMCALCFMLHDWLCCCFFINFFFFFCRLLITVSSFLS